MRETEGRGMITNMDLKVYMGSLKNNPRITEEMLRLVEEDLRFGLTPKETEEYTGKKLDYAQMKVYSRCLRSGYGRDAVSVITKEGLSGEQMAVALEFYEKGVPLAVVEEITEKSNQTAFTMKKLFSDVMEKLETAGRSADGEAAYAKELMEQICRVVEKIDFQEKRWDNLNERLKELQTAGQNEEIQNSLRAQLTEKNRIVEKQQDEIHKIEAEAARLRSDLEAVRIEKLCLESRIEEMEKQEKIQQFSVGTSCFPADGRSGEAAYRSRNARAGCRTERKKKGLLAHLFTGNRFKKKTDIIKIAAEKRLEPDQLVQIRKGIEKGLTRQQLMVLISHSLPAAQMEEIINIAVYENRQEGGD